MRSKSRVFFFDGCYDGTIGGSHTCLLTLVLNLDDASFVPIVGFYQEHWISRRLREAGVDTRILQWSAPVDLVSKLKAKWPHFRHVYVPLTLAQKVLNLVLFFITSVKRARFLKRESIDLLHLNNSLATNHDWMLGAWLARVKVVSHERGISVRMSGTLRLLSRVISHHICVSQLVRDHLIGEGIVSRRTSVIYDGIDLERFKAVRDPELVRNELGLTEGHKVIGVLGNVKEWKGQESVVRATAILVHRWDNLVCLLVGTADHQDPYVTQLKRIVRQQGLEGKVKFLGFRNDASEILQAMDVVCHTSIAPEPFGMVNLEAMYLGRPVVSTRLGGPLEVIEDGIDGILIEPGNPSMLAEQVGRILSDQEFAQRLGRAARQTVINKFDARKTVKAIQAIYAAVRRERTGQSC